MFRMTHFGWIALGYSFVSIGFQSYSLAIEAPKCIDTSLTIELVASEPEIMTPVSCRFDSKGRLFVVESHTHFPPDSYDGPKQDRIKLFDDPDGDGKLDRIRVFYEGTKKTMSLAIGRDDSIYVATRASILRLRDTNSDDVADEVTTIVSLDTVADYPHNGLSGLLLEETDGKPPTLTFGLGENFGEKYELRGSDGSLQTGKGEGGNIFQCSPDGSKLRRIATGFWNPFGICRDDGGRLLMVDNDADAMPPCRIVHVVPQGDYGFQFRFGRAGTHPLQAWNGQLPGTLPMVAGTGEAPCAILCHRGQYWVTSWGDNRIERYTPKHQGAATVTSTREDAIIGGSMFRPVDMAISPDGSMYVTDWVDRSYNVHRTGRIWRIRFATPATGATAEGMKPSLAEKDVKAFTSSHRDVVQQVLSGKQSDPFLMHAIMTLPDLAAWLPASGLTGIEKTPFFRRAMLLNARWKQIACEGDGPKPEEVVSLIAKALDDEDESIRMIAVKWAAESGDKSFLPAIRKQLEKDSQSTQFLAMVAASISFLETGKVEKGGFDTLTRDTLVGIANDTSRSDRIRTMALLLVPPSSPQWKLQSLAAMIQTGSRSLARAAARHVASSTIADPEQKVLLTLLANKDISNDIKDDLSVKRIDPNSLDSNTNKHPDIDDLDTWLKQVGEGGDIEKGWRVFFSNSKGKCAACHMRDGRGSSVGPDLTNIRTMAPDRKRLLESILHPSREIGPMYTTWKVLTKDGQVIVGLKLNGGGVGQSARYLLADSTTVDVKLEDIEEQAASEKSIMPEGLVQSMSMDDIRDLLAFLASPPES